MSVMEQVQAYYTPNRWWIAHLLNGASLCFVIWALIMVTPG